MSAKPSKHGGKKAGLTPIAPGVTPPAVSGIGPAGATMPAGTGDFTPWIESSDPKKRTWGKVALIVVWIYVAALWLLALDQTFDWGIFGPRGH